MVLDREESPVSTITDGDQIRLKIALGESANSTLAVSFTLKSTASSIGACTIPAGGDECQTEPFASLGWHWLPDGQAVGRRILQASGEGIPAGLEAEVQVRTRPVVLVHGFSSSWEAWTHYLGAQGFLAGIGLQGYAVGDGQVSGTMNTGNLADPAGRTHTIAENAAILGEYIANVKRVTGAQMVDLVSHSMGGLISRYYIDRVMQERDVAQLILLGSPMAGTDCADLPAALGLYLPAALEIRPGYVQDIFNLQITHRRGVPFHALAGVPIREAFESPCTQVPTDLAVSLQSVTAIHLEAEQMPVLHTDLNQSEQVFNGFVKAWLQTPPGGFPQEPDPSPISPVGERLQFTRVFSGHMEAGSSRELTIQIDPGVSVASFALYDTTRSLEVSVKGASGNTIELSPEKNGLVVVKDPEALIYLGYGFQDPKPGVWQVSLLTTSETPESGADYALTAHFVGGAELNARLSTFLPRVNENVQLSASLDLGGQAIRLDEAHAEIRSPDGSNERVALEITGRQAQASWKPESPGLHGVDLQVAGLAPDGTQVERAAFLAVEAQPGEGLTRRTLGLGAAFLVALGLMATLGLRRRRSHANRNPRS
jgi:pimeloyl-ACP methyl ester carboxylesterase